MCGILGLGLLPECVVAAVTDPLPLVAGLGFLAFGVFMLSRARVVAGSVSLLIGGVLLAVYFL